MFNTLLISKDNLIKNIKQVKQNNPNSLVCAMVKANAYGVGQKQVVQVLNDYADYFGVACFFEAKQVAKYTDKPILIVGALEKISPDIRFEYMCQDVEDVKFLSSFNLPIKIHLKINSGMNRFGLKDKSEFVQILREIKQSKLHLVGVFTHFATTDDFVHYQYKNFVLFSAFAKKIFPNLIIHTDNSAVNKFFNHKLDMVRIGFDLYNYDGLGFSSVCKINSTVVAIRNISAGETVGYNKRFVSEKNMQVAVLPIGYADGFSLAYIGIDLNVHGKKCRVVNVCMDCFMLDVTNLDIKKGDKIYILNKSNPLSNFAKHSGLSEYEVMTNFSSLRAKRKLVASVTHNDSQQPQQ